MLTHFIALLIVNFEKTLIASFFTFKRKGDTNTGYNFKRQFCTQLKIRGKGGSSVFLKNSIVRVGGRGEGVHSFRTNSQRGDIIFGFIIFLLTSFFQFPWGGSYIVPPYSSPGPTHLVCASMVLHETASKLFFRVCFCALLFGQHSNEKMSNNWKLLLPSKSCFCSYSYHQII